MAALSLPASLIAAIVDDPSDLAHPESIGISQQTAAYILSHGYTKGYRSVFILNACLAAVATFASVGMIRHKELTRGDDEKRRNEAKAGIRAQDPEKAAGDMEMQKVQTSTKVGEV